MSKSILTINTPETCDDCPLCIYTAEEKRAIGYCNTSDDDYYCKALDRFIEYNVVSDDELAIAEKPTDCPLQELKTGKWVFDKGLKQFFCSECNEPSLSEDDVYIYSMDFPKFCNNCGTKMEG